MLRPGLHALLLVQLAVAAWGASALADPFPMPASLAPRVDFWTRVYTEVGTNGGLVHDNRDLSIVYEVVRLPEGSSSAAVERTSRHAKGQVQGALQRLAAGKRTGLSDLERHVLAQFPDGVSNQTLRAAAGRIRFQLGQADKFRAGISRMGRWEGYIRSALRERGVPEDLVALPHVESSFNPDAHSHAGASGIWQFTRSTGRLFMRVDHIVDERLDPWIATVGAARLLKKNHEMLREWPLAITAYNHGPAGMGRAVRMLGTRDIGRITEEYTSRSFGFASRNFYSEFLAARRIDADPDRYFGPIRKEPGQDPEIVVLDHFYKIGTLARVLEVPVGTLRAYNRALLTPVWNEQKYAPRGYGLRLPRRPDKPVGKVMLAQATAAERFAEQTVDRRYRVKRGDTLSRIARHHHVRESELIAVNNLRNKHFLRVGQVLEIPTRGAAPSARVASVEPQALPPDGLYEVRPGDNLDLIAARFQVSRRDLQATNRIQNPNRIAVGQVLEIPGGRAPAAPSAPPAPAESAPATTATTYAVRSGDTLHAIARRHGVSEQALASHNDLRDRHRIQVGQRLAIPGTVSAPAEVPPAPPPQARSAPPAHAAPELPPEAPPEVVQVSTATVSAAAATSADSLPLAPQRYAVDERGGVIVQPEETLGHYAEWLETTATGLRERNGLAAGRALPLGHRVELDFARISRQTFEERRLAHHRAIQERFFSSYRVEGTTDHVVRKGDTVWKLAQGSQSVPMWLLHDYNPGLDLASLRMGQTVKIPLVRPRG